MTENTAMRLPSLALLGAFGLLVGCGGSCGTDTGPVPGGFPADRQIVRAAQVRLTASGLDGLAQTLSSESVRGLSLSCGGDLDCPAGFFDGAGALVPPACMRGRCVEGTDPGPYLAVPVPSGPQGQLELCPGGAAPCRVVARLAGFGLQPRAGAGLTASLDLQLSGDVAVRSGSADCVVRLRPPAGVGPVAVDVDLGVHGGSGATTIGVPAVQLGLPSSAVTAIADPVVGDAADAALCASLDPGPAVLAQLEAALPELVQAQLAGAFGWTCQDGSECPTQAYCSPTGLCTEARTGRTLGAPLGYETRLQLPALLGELGYRGTSGQVDTAIAVGGAADADPDGLSIGVLAGMEAPQPNPDCATITPSPVTRPGYTAPPGLPASSQADLDFDGTPETDYDLAFGASQDLLRQVAWGVYTSGLLCGVISQREFDGLTTGTLELIIPSVRFLARSHLYPRSEAPARLSVYMRNEPQVVIGSGEVQVVSGEGQWQEPLVRLDLDDVEINLSVLVDERYLRVMTITLDLHIGIGALVTPNNRIEPVLGVGVADLVSDVRVSNSELLAEPPESLETSIPTLLSLIVLELSGSQGEIELPDVPGLDLTVLGLRGVEGPTPGVNETVAVYATAAPSMTGNLLGAADTALRISEVKVPETDAFSVTHPGGPAAPEVHLRFDGEAPEGGALEYQVRIDGGPWTGFIRRPEYVLRHPTLALQGAHRVEARARVIGDYKTLDPTPAEIEVVIDSVAPTLDVRVDAAAGAAEIDTWDRIGPVTLEVVTDDARRAVEPGRIELPELEGQGALRIEATDAAGNVTAHALRAPAPPPAEAPPVASGCRSAPGAPLTLCLVLGLGLVRRRR